MAAASTAAGATLAGVNFAGAASAASQTLASTDAAGLVPQNFWNNATGIAGQIGLEADGGSSIALFYSGFTAQWQAAQTGSSASSSPLPNSRLMKGSLLSGPNTSIFVQISGIPLAMTTATYSVVVYCDVPVNSSDVIIKATLESGNGIRVLYVRDRAGQDFAGTFARAAFTSTTPDVPAFSGNALIFTGLSSSDIALSVEPAEANRDATVAVNAIQLIPAESLEPFAPRIISSLAATGRLNEPFSYQRPPSRPPVCLQA
jgi:hypothetical protein